MNLDISMDIHANSVDTDLKIHIHGNSWLYIVFEDFYSCHYLTLNLDTCNNF